MDLIGPLFALLVFFSGLLFIGYLILRGLLNPIVDFVKYNLFFNLNAAGFEMYFRLLHSKFPYFRLLDDEEQRKFINRLRYIRDHKNFRSRDNNLVITEEMEILFSASVAQLTFGLNEYLLDDFSELQLTANAFYSNLIGRNVKGLTFESGRIILSWADFEEGYRITDDKLNLGLHELAHAFWISNIDTDVNNYYDDWHAAAMRELVSIRHGTDSELFRDYAATNIEEFWACCVECFFEAPVEFKSKVPYLYARMCQILNQDMAERMLARLN